jgi:hypothetical protein
MRFLSQCIFILIYSIATNLFAGTQDGTLLASINNYKNFFSNTCSKILENSTLPKQIAGWSKEAQDEKEIRFLDSTLDQEVHIRVVNRGRSQKTLRYTFYRNFDPELFLATDENCKISIARLIERNKNKNIKSISTLSKDLHKVQSIELLNPEVPAIEPKDGVQVALVDTGINYLLPEISKNIARQNPTQLLGYDFEDEDQLPFDVDFVGSPFFPRHHGTSVASILIKEAPFVQIVPYRFSRRNPCSFKDIIDDIGKLDINVALIPMGSKNFKTWKCFHEAAKKHKEILFVVSAGNSNINIDVDQIFPASLELKNILVVSSSTIFGNLAKGSNFGPNSVDLLVHAEQLRVIDHRGVKSIASGSSYAVPRIGAMIARFLTYNPEAKIGEIIEMLRKRAVPIEINLVKLGWIPDPLDDYLFHIDSK